MSYSTLKTALKTACPDTYHLRAPKGKTRYIVWGETGIRGLRADDRMSLAGRKADVYAVTQVNDDTLIDAICAALDDAGIVYSDPMATYDDELVIVVWTLECEVYGG